MRPVRRSGAALVAGIALMGLAAGCGGTGGERPAKAAGSPLQWTATPLVFTTKALPRDRVAMGTVRNTSDQSLQLDAGVLTVVAGDGTRLRSTGQYAAGYAHGLYGAFQKPDPLPPGELSRLGKVVKIAPGQTAPLAVSWSLPAGSDAKRPASVDYGSGRLALPTTVRLGAGL